MQYFNILPLYIRALYTMPPVRSQDVWCAKASYEQKKASQKHWEAFINDMATSCNELLETISEMAEKHNRYMISLLSYNLYTHSLSSRNSKAVATQLYAGTKKLVSLWKPSLFNAIQYATAKENHEAGELQK